MIVNFNFDNNHCDLPTAEADCYPVCWPKHVDKQSADCVMTYPQQMPWLDATGKQFLVTNSQWRKRDGVCRLPSRSSRRCAAQKFAIDNCWLWLDFCVSAWRRWRIRFKIVCFKRSQPDHGLLTRIYTSINQEPQTTHDFTTEKWWHLLRQKLRWPLL